MNNDLKKTQHYTNRASYICGNLLKYIPEEVKLIEPFCGKGDLISLFPNHLWETYDIEDNGFSKIQDTLLNPPNYENKWVITNPPFLAKNKAQNKNVFEKYGVDDLYKAAILTITGCQGGMLIIPTNFFTDERSARVRTLFLKQFQILEMNVFTEPVFDSTTHSVCSFAFKRKGNIELSFPVWIKPEDKQINIKLNEDRVAGDFFKELKKITPIFGRLTADKVNGYITNIKLYALDSRQDRIRLEYDETPYIGKNTDRMLATLTCQKELSQQQEKKLIEKFNQRLEAFREEYADLPLTNYRDFNRKRIGFTFAYQLLTKIYFDFY